jgi:hypothetical protein
MAHWAHVKVITHSLDLMGIHPSVGVFFISLAPKKQAIQGQHQHRQGWRHPLEPLK